MDRAVSEWPCERLVHTPVLVEKREAVEIGAHDGHLEVVAGPGAILDTQFDRVGECTVEKYPDTLGVHRDHARCAGYAAGVRFLRGLLLFKLGFWAGMLTSAALLQRMFPSRGDEESDEVALVAILNGVALKSRAKAFRGGSMFSWLGGIAVDLREAELAPDAHLDVRSLFGGIALRVPPGWKVESAVKSIGGGVTVAVPEPESDAAPTLRLDGFTAFGGIAVGAKPADAEPES